MLIRQTILYLPAQLLGPGFQFVAAVVWTHWLAPDAYGVLAYVLALQELAAVSVTWWSQYMLRYIRDFAGEQARGGYQKVENLVLLVGAAAQIALAVGTLAMLDAHLTRPLIFATALYTVARSLLGHVAERARAEERIGLYTIAQLVGPVAGFAFGLFFVERFAASPASAIAGLGLSNAAVLVALWIWMGFGVSVSVSDPVILRRALGFGGPLVAAAAVTWASPNGIRLVVQHLDGAAAVGLVSVGWGIGQRFAAVVAMAVTAAAFPLAVAHLQAGRREEALHHIAMNAAILFGLLAPATAGLLLLTPDLTRLAIAPSFRATTLVILPIAALAGAVRNFRLHFGDQAFLLFEQTRTTVTIAAVEAAATLLFCWVGDRFGGLTGAALGCLAGAVTGAVYCFALCLARNQLPMPTRHLARILAATLIMAGTLRMIPWSAVSGNLLAQMLAQALAGAAFYVLSLSALYPHETRRGLRWARRLGPLPGVNV